MGETVVCEFVVGVFQGMEMGWCEMVNCPGEGTAPAANLMTGRGIVIDVDISIDIIIIIMFSSFNRPTSGIMMTATIKFELA